MNLSRLEELKMKMVEYHIFSCWGPRPETPASIAQRFLTLIDRLAPIDPAFGNWICALYKHSVALRDIQPVPLADIRNDMTAYVETCVVHDDYGPTPMCGYRVGAINSLDRNPRGLSIGVLAGQQYSSPHVNLYINTARINTLYGETPDPAILSFSIFRPALLALVESFAATWCCAGPANVSFPTKDGMMSRVGWMSYVSPRFAPLITPPSTAVVEYRPDGGLFMAATRETFVGSNPDHMAVARDIKAAMAPLNALPWPPDLEPEDGAQ
jgi:hypothetical protein